MAGVDSRGPWPGKVCGQDGRAGGAGATKCTCVGFGAIRAGGFLPVEAAGGYKP